MGMPIENFKGIEFVRISAMPKDQQERIWKTFQQDKIIKIVRDQALMNDCILHSDFAQWQTNQSRIQRPPAPSHEVTSVIGKFAFE